MRFGGLCAVKLNGAARARAAQAREMRRLCLFMFLPIGIPFAIWRQSTAGLFEELLGARNSPLKIHAEAWSQLSELSFVQPDPCLQVALASVLWIPCCRTGLLDPGVAECRSRLQDCGFPSAPSFSSRADFSSGRAPGFGFHAAASALPLAIWSGAICLSAVRSAFS